MADRGGWREEILHMPEIQASFLYLFSYAPLGEGGRISGELFWSLLGGCLLPTPSRQPPFETSIWSIWVHCPRILVSRGKNGQEESRLLNSRRLRSSRPEAALTQHKPKLICWARGNTMFLVRLGPLGRRFPGSQCNSW